MKARGPLSTLHRSVHHALPDRLKQVADELTHQYLVTYARPESLIPPEKITITAKRTGLLVRGTPVKSK